MSDIEVHGTIDAREMVCSRPILDVKKALVRLSVGQVLEVLCEEEVAGTIARVFVQVQGHELVLRESHGQHVTLYLRRTG